MTRKEIPFLFMAIGACAFLQYRFEHTWIRYILFLYAWGLSFETITQNLWKYSPALSRTPFAVPGTDINILFPFGWAFMMSGSALLCESYWHYLVVTGIVGVAMEILFYNLKYWTYDYNAKFMGLFKPYLPKVTILGVPVQIIISYPIVIGSMNWCIMEKLLE